MVESGIREAPKGFGILSAKLGPETLLDRQGSSYNAGCIINQTRRPILRPFRDDARVLPDSRLRAEVGT